MGICVALPCILLDPGPGHGGGIVTLNHILNLVDAALIRGIPSIVSEVDPYC